MNNLLKIYIVAFACLMLSACGKSGFRLEFDLPEKVNGNYPVAYYASDKRGGMVVETAAVVDKGKGYLECRTVNPAVVYLTPSGKGLPIVIYAEKGDKIKIKGTERDPYKWIVEGNDINKELSEWRNANASALNHNITREINRGVADYVNAHKSSQLSPLLLLTYFDRNADETQFRRLWQGLEGDALDAPWAKMISRSDIPAGVVKTPGRLVSATFRSLQNGVDTLRPDSVKATLLYFWNNGLSKRKEKFDSIRKLAKEFPDSSKRLIADVCLDQDSLSWRSALRYDSLKNVARLWAPAGMADSKVMRLGVTSSPFFIVISHDGNQRYRGKDSKEAFETFRSLLRK